jgi:rfaE bifunctional protein kinase chain/domain
MRAIRSKPDRAQPSRNGRSEANAPGRSPENVNRLTRLLRKFKGRRVAVLGDFVADVFIYGEISRISREAPVLILNHRDTQLVPGGGANAVHNLRALGANPLPVGCVGNDSEGRQLLAFLKKLGIDTRGIRVERSWKTPAKTRILAGAPHSHRQQIVRLDSGGSSGAKASPAGRSQQKTLTAGPELKAAIPACEALLVSDYGYGTVTKDLVRQVLRKGIPSTIDSRFSMTDFTGMTAATPNEPEVEAALGIHIGHDAAKLEAAGRTLLRKLKHEALLITRGKDGMALFEKGRKTEHIPIHGSDEIADVTGAGDTVIATFTLALAAGGTFSEAARLANYAGGIVVMKHGTRPVTYAELLRAVQENES